MEPKGQNPQLAFIPSEEAQRLKQQMLQFQQEVGKLKQMAREARARAFQSMQKTLLNAERAQQHLLKPTIPNQTKMASQSPKKATGDTSGEVPGIDHGMQALKYTDLQMAKLIDKMQHQVEKSMQAAMSATGGGTQAIAEAMKQTEQALQGQMSQTEENLANEEQFQQENIMAQMEQAQQVVAGTVNPPASKKTPPKGKSAGKN